ncbi:hypothetical protein D2M30_1909 [Bacillus amyloliquefaciens]|nr:hypothetical protein D2M30_1909 [Bacillus amyloliquefaciens]
MQKNLPPARFFSCLKTLYDFERNRRDMKNSRMEKKLLCSQFS